MITFPTSNVPAASGAPASSPLLTPSASTVSFAEQLAGELEQILSQSQSGSQFEIKVSGNPNQSATGAGLIFQITNVTPAPASTPVPPPATAAPSPAAVAEPTNHTIVPFFDSLVSHSTDNTPSVWPTAPQKPLTSSQAYWAMQPPAVQALQSAPDQETRGAEAMQLAQEGYTIDVPIMVWGWNPLTTMQIRQDDGYTWVPSALQNPIAVGPNLQMAGFPSYDPSHPPQGSILVTTDFAKGTTDDPTRSTAAIVS